MLMNYNVVIIDHKKLQYHNCTELSSFDYLGLNVSSFTNNSKCVVDTTL